jgi:hypothetical protein
MTTEKTLNKRFMAFLLETGSFPAFEHKRLMVQDKLGNGDWGESLPTLPSTSFQ